MKRVYLQNSQEFRLNNQEISEETLLIILKLPLSGKITTKVILSDLASQKMPMRK